MISLLDSSSAPDFTAVCAGDPVLGAQPYTLLQCYGLADPLCLLWLARNRSGAPTAAIARQGGWLAVCATPAVDLDEILEFLNIIGGFRQLEGPPFVCALLQGKGTLQSGLLMEYRGGPFPDDFSPVRTEPPLRDVFHVICRGHNLPAGRARWESWYTHTSHLLRHGLGTAAALYRQGEPVACGGVYAVNQGAGVIGSVAALPAFRGQGYGSLITKYLVNYLLERDRLPVLACGSDSLAGFYNRLGFAVTGEWARITLHQ